MSDCGGSTARNGSLGKVVVADQKIARITEWGVNESTGETAWGDSDGGDFTNRKGGRRDATVSFAGKFDEDSKVYNLFRPKDNVKLVLWENGEDYWVFPCVLIQTFALTYDVDGKTVVGWTATAGANGTYYYPGESGAPSETLPT